MKMKQDKKIGWREARRIALNVLAETEAALWKERAEEARRLLLEPEEEQTECQS